jgi:hypothetical protein
MRLRLIAGLTAALLALPMAAAADEHVDCYVDPTHPDCDEVLGEEEDAVEEEVDETEPLSVTETVEEDEVETAALAVTGASTSVLLATALLLLLTGSALLFGIRRRGSRTS